MRVVEHNRFKYDVRPTFVHRRRGVVRTPRGFSGTGAAARAAVEAEEMAQAAKAAADSEERRPRKSHSQQL